MDNIGEWTPAVEKPPAKLRERAQILRHMILPAWSLALGLITLFGFIRWLCGELPDRDIDGQLSLVIGGIFTVLGGWELRFWRRRLRGLRVPAVAAAE